MSDPFPGGMPKGTPPWLRKTGIAVLALSTILVGTGVGVRQIPAMHESCMQMQICSAGEPPQLAPLNTGWMDGGATWDGAAGPTLQKYRTENPNWNIDYVKGREYSDKDWLGHVKYRFEMTFTATPKWTGVFA